MRRTTHCVGGISERRRGADAPARGSMRSVNAQPVVVLDSNVWLTEQLLRSNSARRLLDHARSGAVRLIVPEVVLDEVAGKIRRESEELLVKVGSLRESAKRFMDTSSFDELKVRISQNSEGVAERLRDLSDQFQMTKCEVSEIGHSSLILRAINRRRPFNEKGSGYRDALIWHTVIDLAASSTADVHFVSNDSAFFGQNGLHEHLATDLSEHSLEGRVHLHRRLKDLVDLILPHAVIGTVEPEDGGGEAAEELPGLERLLDRFRDSVAEAVSNRIENMHFNSRQLALPRSADDIVLYDIESVVDVELRGEPTELPTEYLYSEFAAQCACVFEVTMATDDAELLNLIVAQSGDGARVKVDVSKDLELTGNALVSLIEDDFGDSNDSMTGTEPELDCDLQVEIESVDVASSDPGHWFWT